MATISFLHLASGVLTPGAYHTIGWTNLAAERVRHVNVDVDLPLLFAYAGSSAKVEISRVNYRHYFDGGTFRRQIWCRVENIGTVDAIYRVHMTVAKE
jgi:hypothetical protein